MWYGGNGKALGFYLILLRFLTLEDYVTLLMVQYKALTSFGLSYEDSNKMFMDEFDLVVNIHKQVIKDKEQKRKAKSFAM